MPTCFDHSFHAHTLAHTETWYARRYVEFKFLTTRVVLHTQTHTRPPSPARCLRTPWVKIRMALESSCGSEQWVRDCVCTRACMGMLRHSDCAGAKSSTLFEIGHRQGCINLETYFPMPLHCFIPNKYSQAYFHVLRKGERTFG